jgi:hypothetical protein
MLVDRGSQWTSTLGRKRLEAGDLRMVIDPIAPHHCLRCLRCLRWWPRNNGEAIHIISHLCRRPVVVLGQALLLGAQFSLHGITNIAQVLQQAVVGRQNCLVALSSWLTLLIAVAFRRGCAAQCLTALKNKR